MIGCLSVFGFSSPFRLLFISYGAFGRLHRGDDTAGDEQCFDDSASHFPRELMTGLAVLCGMVTRCPTEALDPESVMA